MAADSVPRKGPAGMPSPPPLACLLKRFFRSGCGAGPRSWMLPFRPVCRCERFTTAGSSLSCDGH